jgi:peptidoglycan/LPS O-acetylase OafA/YrhL
MMAAAHGAPPVPMDLLMPASLSLYLDLTRFLAAFAVLLFHLWPQWFPNFPLPWPGHAAVVVFFVLSGYMIAHAAHQPGVVLRTYLQHRAARILSVAVPALLLSIVIAPLAGNATIHSGGPMDLSPAAFWGRIVASLLFIGQSWNLTLAPPYNQPYWSLCYEVWYYVMYGAWLFAPRRWRLPALLLAALCAGPKILLLAPVWLLGVAVWHLRNRLPERAAFPFFFGFMLVAFLLFWFDVGVLLRNRMGVQWPQTIQYLHESALFPGDYLLGFAVAGNFLGAAAMAHRLQPLFRFESPIRFAASYSFSIYLYHMPLAVLLWNGLGLRSPVLMASLLAVLLLVLGMMTERQLPLCRRVMRRALA